MSGSTVQVAPLVHGLIRLRWQDTPVGVCIVKDPVDATVFQPLDLPVYALELHVFTSSALADGFAQGVNYLGGNRAAAEAWNKTTIIAKFDDLAIRTGSLEEALPLFDHTGHGCTLSDVAAEVRRAEAVIAQDKQRKADVNALEDSWRSTLDALDSFPKDAEERPVFGVEIIGDDTLLLNGSFDPSVSWSRYGSSGNLARIERLSEGRIRITTPYLFPATRESYRHRLGALQEACTKVGFTFDEHTLKPVVDLVPGEAVHAHLMALTPLWRTLLRLAEEANAVQEAVTLLADRDIGRTLKGLMEGRRIWQYSRNQPGRLQASDRTGRDITCKLVTKLDRLGFINIACCDTMPGSSHQYNLRWDITEAGKLFLEDDPEALMRALAQHRRDRPGK